MSYIEFEQIPGSIRKPGIYGEYNLKLASNNLPANLQKVMLMGQKTSSGTKNSGQVFQVFSDEEAKNYFGAGSMLHLMARAAIKANPYINLFCIALDDASQGVAAQGSLELSGTASSNGFLRIWIANFLTEIAIQKNDSAADVINNLKTELDKKSYLPVSYSTNSGTITFTAKNKGKLGNEITIEAEVTVSSITKTVTAMSNGDVDPDIDNTLTAISGTGYTILVCPYNNSTALSKIKEHLDFVSGPLEQRPATAYVGFRNATMSDVITISTSLNNGRIVAGYLRKTKSLPYELGAAIASVKASVEDPAKPLNNLEIKGIGVPKMEDRLTRQEQEVLLWNGVTPIEIVDETPRIVRMVTTYVSADAALLDITTICTLDYTRKAITERLRTRYGRSKLSSKTPPMIKSDIYAVLKMLENLEILENVDENKDRIIVQRNSQDANRVDCAIPADVVNGLHIIANRIDLIL